MAIVWLLNLFCTLSFAAASSWRVFNLYLQIIWIYALSPSIRFHGQIYSHSHYLFRNQLSHLSKQNFRVFFIS